MKNIILIISLALTAISCKNNNPKSETEKLLNEVRKSQMIDSIIQSTQKNIYLDSTGMDNSPVLVTSAKLVSQEYSNYKNIRLTYKNISKKTIQAIRFEWYGENSFGEPADMGTKSIIIPGAGGGFTEVDLKPNSTTTSEWDILSKDGKKILMARAYEVAFTDGTKWKLQN